jgi:hypothetical protein
VKVIRNTGNDRVVDVLAPHLTAGHQLDLVTPALSLFAFERLAAGLTSLSQTRLVLPPAGLDLQLLGSPADRPSRNRLQARWLARRFMEWLGNDVICRSPGGAVPQGAAVLRAPNSVPVQAVVGGFSWTTAGLGLTPGNPLSLIQAAETADEARLLSSWFDEQWASLSDQPDVRQHLFDSLGTIAAHGSPHATYARILQALFGARDDALDEEKIVKSATGIRQTIVWKKLYKFQRDGVVGAIDKLNRFGGCIIADSVGLGKTFEALAIVKYHELRNDRVLVLCPKRLRDNWTLYKADPSTLRVVLQALERDRLRAQ